MNRSTEAWLCPAVEGVEYWVDGGTAGSIRGLVLVDALRTHFGANDDPQSWLAAYQHHREELAALTMAVYQRGGQRGMVVLKGKSDNGPLGMVCPDGGSSTSRRGS